MKGGSNMQQIYGTYEEKSCIVWVGNSSWPLEEDWKPLALWRVRCFSFLKVQQLPILNLEVVDFWVNPMNLTYLYFYLLENIFLFRGLMSWSHLPHFHILICCGARRLWSSSVVRPKGWKPFKGCLTSLKGMYQHRQVLCHLESHSLWAVFFLCVSCSSRKGEYIFAGVCCWSWLVNIQPLLYPSGNKWKIQGYEAHSCP